MQTFSTDSAAAVAAARTVLIPEILDFEDVAYWLRCSRAHARALMRARVIPGRHIGRRWLVTRAALLRALETPTPHIVPGGRRDE